MAPDLITLSAICHEESVHLVHKPLNTRRSFFNLKTPQVSVSEIDPNSSTADMTNSSDARKRSLVSMYSTGFVFNQNQKNLVKALPWSNSTNNSSSAKVAHNPVPSSNDMRRMVSQFVQGRGNGRKEAGDKQVQSLQNEKLRAEHAASMFALLT